MPNLVNSYRHIGAGDGQYVALLANTGASADEVTLSSDYGVDFTEIDTVIHDSVGISGTGQYILIGRTLLSSQMKVSDDYGATWTTVGGSIAHDDTKVSETGEYMISVATGTDEIQLSSDYGATWGESSGKSLAYEACAVNLSGEYQLACSNESAVVSDDYGATWTTYTPTKFGGAATCAISETGQYMVKCTGIDAEWWLSTNYGVTWVKDTTSFTNKVQWIDINNTGDYIIVCFLPKSGFPEKIQVSDDTGSTWTEYGVTGQYTAVSCNGLGDRMIKCEGSISTFEDVSISDDYGATWTVEYNGEDWNTVLMSKRV